MPAPSYNPPFHNPVVTRDFVPDWSWFWMVLEIISKIVTRRTKGAMAIIRWPCLLLLYYLPFFEPRYIPGGDAKDEVDDSVYLRRAEENCGYDPRNLRRPAPEKLTRWWEAESR